MWFGHSLMYMCNDPEGLFQYPVRYKIFESVMDYFNEETSYTEARIPGAYHIAQNFPNPFNPVTTIRFDVKERGHVSLKIYNVAGQLVKTLVDETRDASSYSILWDGTNNLGAKVASGIYFYRLVAGDFEQTKKMVLIR